METHASKNSGGLFFVEEGDQRLFGELGPELEAGSVQRVHLVFARHAARIDQVNLDVLFRCAGARGKFRFVLGREGAIERFEVCASGRFHIPHTITIAVTAQGKFITFLVHLPLRYMLA